MSSRVSCAGGHSSKRLMQVGVMVNAAAIADPELAATLVTEPLLAALEAELASLKDAQPSKVSWSVMES